MLERCCWQSRPPDSKVTLKLIKDGSVIQGYHEITNADLMSRGGFDLVFENLNFLALNSIMGGSLMFKSAIKPRHEALLKFYWNGAQWVVSLYHAPGKERHDLSAIATKYGGGGHRGACGFNVTSLKVLGL
jgi:hypothetical protein